MRLAINTVLAASLLTGCANSSPIDGRELNSVTTVLDLFTSVFIVPTDEGAVLVDAGFRAEDAKTTEVIERWRGKPAEACAVGNSAAYLKRSGQEHDLEFVLGHVDDLDAAFMLKHDEVVMLPADD